MDNVYTRRMKKGQYKHTQESIIKAVEVRRKNGSYHTSWNKGIPMKESTKLKLRIGHKEKGILPPKRRGIAQNVLGNNGRWKGDDANYFALHARVRKYFKRPKNCEICGTSEKRLEWANVNGQYRFIREDWISLCGKCHRKQEKTVTNKRFYNGKLK